MEAERFTAIVCVDMLSPQSSNQRSDASPVIIVRCKGGAGPKLG
jgi:hypothetical protein